MTVRSERMASRGSETAHGSIFWDWEHHLTLGRSRQQNLEHYETYNSLDLLGSHRYEEENWKWGVTGFIPSVFLALRMKG